MARPLPIPSPAQPAPVTMATRPAREREGGSSGIPSAIVEVWAGVSDGSLSVDLVCWTLRVQSQGSHISHWYFLS